MVLSRKLTRNNIAHDLNISPHTLVVDYLDEKITYVFSSRLYKEKFLSQMVDNRKKINESLSKRFGIEVIFDRLADVKLYDSIEKRGFLIVLENGEKIKWLNNIILDGNRVTTKP